MRLICGCGNRVRVVPADAGRSIRCSCGNMLEVPSLSRLKKLGPQQRALEQLADPRFWEERGCYLCGAEALQPVWARLELQPARFARLPPKLGPAAILTAIWPVLGVAYFAATVNDKVQLAEAENLDLRFLVCLRCSMLEEVSYQCVARFAEGDIADELREDFPQLRFLPPPSR